ncbi:MAG: hypothetical protein U1E46_01650 [Hyphomicrobiales bacterium]
MITRSLASLLVALFVVLWIPVGEAQAGVRVGSSVSNWRSISCSKGQSLLRRHYRIVQRIDCRGSVFVYRAQAFNMNRFQIALRQRDGRVNSVHRLRGSSNRW